VLGHELLVCGEVGHGDEGLVVRGPEHPARFDDLVEGGQGGFERFDGVLGLVGEFELDVYLETAAERCCK
jgi:hypothetical protein